MKYLIVGLGNPGQEYSETRHNIGFKILDALIGASNVVFEPNRHALQTEIKFRGRSLVLIKPTTYMNLSGKAVNYWMQKELVPVENVLVLVDDLALPFGTIRVKQDGSPGGHNGLIHISDTLGHNNYSRLRFGIGNNFPKGTQVDYVLGEWSADEKEFLNERIQIAVKAVQSFVMEGIRRTMNSYNKSFNIEQALMQKKQENDSKPKL